MDSKYIDFIGMYEDVYPIGYCKHLIDQFELFREGGHVSNRQDSEGRKKLEKQDEFFFINMANHSLQDYRGKSTVRIFWDGLQKCFDDYVREYDILRDLNIRSSVIKLQKTPPGGGYHIWHCEQQSGDGMQNRALAFALYLNTLEEGCAGETEYIYQRIRIPPKENCMVIWPAGFTHTHRGNVVYGNEAKYIATGWFYYD